MNKRYDVLANSEKGAAVADEVGGSLDVIKLIAREASNYNKLLKPQRPESNSDRLEDALAVFCCLDMLLRQDLCYYQVVQWIESRWHRLQHRLCAIQRHSL